MGKQYESKAPLWHIHIFAVGKKVWYEDDDDSRSSFPGTIIRISGEVMSVKDRLVQDSGVLCTNRQLTLLNDDWSCPYCGKPCYEDEACDELTAI